MLRTLGAEMPRATPTGKNYTDIYLTFFRKKCEGKLRRIICVGLDGVKLSLGFGRNGTQKLDFDKVNLSNSNSNLYTITRMTYKLREVLN